VTRAGLYLHALRAARRRQLRARAVRPLRRRSFPPAAEASFRPLDVPLWRTHAFAGADEVAGDGSVRLLGADVAFPPADWSLPGEPRLRRFHLHYGDEVLGWARRGDSAAAAAALDAWIAGNPPRPGDAWHPYPLSTRVGNWTAALSLDPGLVRPAVVASLARQLAHLQRNVEDDVLGNHVVRNARALVLGGTALDLPAPAGQGLALLRRELPEQVLPDGGHYERSPAYHLAVLRDLLEVRAVSGAEWLDGPIGRMTAFAAALVRPDGAPALFNDGALELAPALELPAAPDGLAVFPDTGYAVARREGVWLAFDCGPPAPAFLPAHAHADALSFQLRVDGRPLVVDPGSYTYEPGPDRDWFRSTAAHSTIGLGGRDQFELWGAFRAGPLPAPRLVGTDPLEAEVRLGDVVFRRRLLLGPDELVVEDELDGAGEVEVRSTLPLGGPARVDQTGPLPVTTEPGRLAERMLESTPVEVLRAAGRVRLPARLGWRIGLRSGA
jgi:hypothetical protein